jgi:hypothetical protein
MLKKKQLMVEQHLLLKAVLALVQCHKLLQLLIITLYQIVAEVVQHHHLLQMHQLLQVASQDFKMLWFLFVFFLLIGVSPSYFLYQKIKAKTISY